MALGPHSSAWELAGRHAPPEPLPSGSRSLLAGYYVLLLYLS